MTLTYTSWELKSHWVVIHEQKTWWSYQYILHISDIFFPTSLSESWRKRWTHFYWLTATPAIYYSIGCGRTQLWWQRVILLKKCRSLSWVLWTNIEQAPTLKINLMTHRKRNASTVCCTVIQLLSKAKGQEQVRIFWKKFSGSDNNA